MAVEQELLVVASGQIPLPTCNSFELFPTALEQMSLLV